MTSPGRFGIPTHIKSKDGRYLLAVPSSHLTRKWAVLCRNWETKGPS